MYSGNALSIQPVDPAAGLLELVIDLKDSSVNKIDQAFLVELGNALDELANDNSVNGLLIRSAKSEFIVGADVFEFPALFSQSDNLMRWLDQGHGLLKRLESLPFPILSAINGLALGGGFELALATDLRLVSESARLGLPEVKLGLCPGWGGTVRLSRIAGSVPALEVMLSGRPLQAKDAVNLGVAMAAAQDEDFREQSIALLRRMIATEIDWREFRARKQLTLPNTDAAVVDSQEVFSARFKPMQPEHYPAQQHMVELIQEHSKIAFYEALEREKACFAKLADTTEADSLIGLFISDQHLRQKARQLKAEVKSVDKAAVLGAGIMGGGIAYQSALNATPVVLKDIREEALQLGRSTVEKLLSKQVEKGRMSPERETACLDNISFSLDNSALSDVDLVVEAVVENESVKAAVLKETEEQIPDSAILTSNTSTISITALAKNLSRPEQFCGMHFFNPVPLMPLVEVIRGQQTSEETIEATLKYAFKLGKMPIIVNDCPGFLVNRVLFPYFNAFNRLLHDGVDFERIDRVMQAFGWPMGPAYLADVIGLDTMVHADQVLQQGYPDRMLHDDKPIIELLLEQGALGQKNAHGFYDYSNGSRNKVASSGAFDLIEERVEHSTDISDADIVDRMMIPLCLEAFLCLHEGVVASAEEVDMGLILGLGFPKFRGGALRYIDHSGHMNFAEKVKAWQALGPLYSLPTSFIQRMTEQRTFFDCN